MTLNENLERYYQLQKEVEEREEEMKFLKEQIVTEMKTQNITSQNTGTVEGKLVDKQTFKYNDELAMITYLREHKLENFINSKVNTTMMNKELKAKGVLFEDLKPYYTENNSSSLSVKSVK